MCHSRQNIGSGRVCWWWPPAYTLFWSYSCLQPYRELEAPSSHGKHIFFLHVDSPGGVSQQAEHWQGPSLVVASLQWGWWQGWAWTFPVPQGGVGWTALTWVWESLSHGGRGCCRWGCSIPWCSCLWQLNPQTGTWLAPSFSFLYHPDSMKLSTRNFLQESWPKGKETHLSLACTPLQSYRLLQALYSCEHREPHTTHCLCIPLWSYRQLKALHSHGWRDLHTLHHPCAPSGT